MTGTPESVLARFGIEAEPVRPEDIRIGDEVQRVETRSGITSIVTLTVESIFREWLHAVGGGSIEWCRRRDWSQLSAGSTLTEVAEAIGPGERQAAWFLLSRPSGSDPDSRAGNVERHC